MGTRPKTGELLLLDGQNWVWSDCQICSTSGGIGQIGTAAIFGRLAETNKHSAYWLGRQLVILKWLRQILVKHSSCPGVTGVGVLGLAVSGGSAH